MYATRRITALALAAGLLLMAGDAAAQATGALRVKDDAKLFKADTLDKAEAAVERIKKDYDKDVLVETHADGTANPKRFADSRFKAVAGTDVAIVITKAPAKIFVEVDQRTAQKAFTVADSKALEKRMGEGFTSGDRDKGLLAALNVIGDTLEKNVGKRAGKASETKRADGGSSVPSAPITGGFFDGVMGWVCLGAVVLLVVWVLVGLIRAFTGAGQPAGQRPGYYPPPGGGHYPVNQGGYPPPGYAPQAQGGGGGGFFSSLLGGMFGAAAGMAAYNYFTGGSTPSVTPPAYGGTTSPTYPTSNEPVGGGGADWGNPSAPPADDAGGADWSGNSGDTGGADWGGGNGADAGGADWGGGGDSGGADWGGGGADAGGGDWGGGGGDGGGSDW